MKTDQKMQQEDCNSALRAEPAGQRDADARDAARYRLMRAQLSNRELDYYALEGEPQAFIDEYCDAEIEVNNEANKRSKK